MECSEDNDGLENEWIAIGLTHWPQTCLSNVIDFWAEVSDRKDSAGAKMFPNVSDLALVLFSLPFSNASVERIFSQMIVFHSKLRNRLGVRSVEAIFQIRYGVSHYFESCIEFEPYDDMLRNFNAKGFRRWGDEDDIIALEIE